MIKQEFDDLKDITLRGVNKTLYEQFITLSRKTGLSTGEAFNVLLLGVIRQPWKFYGFRSFGKSLKVGVKPEIISDIERLEVAKKDLLSTGNKTMFLFKNIKELIFNGDIDAQTLVKHVKMIQCSHVSFPKTIPKFIQLGLNHRQKEYTHPINKEEIKDVTIRKVSGRLYDEFVSKAKSLGKNIGEFFSFILDNHLPFLEISEEMFLATESEILIVLNEDYIKITNADLEVLGDRGVVFYAIVKLEFAKDVTQELFLKNIIKIINCNKVILPTNIPKLIVLSRVINCTETNIT